MINFPADYQEQFTANLGMMVAAGTPYAVTLDHLQSALNELRIREDMKAQFTTQFLSQVAMQFTQIAASMALQTAEKKIMIQTQHDNAVKQGTLLTKQATKLDADTSLVNTQAQAIEEQVIDNRRIKMIQVMGDTYGTVGAGGLTVSADMWTTFFTKLNDLDTISIPASKAITKVV